MNIHQIHRDKHRQFLAQQRKDPITGEALQSEDRVVFCATCRSAFLVESWEYLDKKHCGQSATLSHFPEMQTIVFQSAEMVYYDSAKFGRPLKLSQKNNNEQSNQTGFLEVIGFLILILIIMNAVSIFKSSFWWIFLIVPTVFGLAYFFEKKDRRKSNFLKLTDYYIYIGADKHP